MDDTGSTSTAPGPAASQSGRSLAGPRQLGDGLLDRNDAVAAGIAEGAEREQNCRHSLTASPIR
jgi:hypothetical protein